MTRGRVTSGVVAALALGALLLGCAGASDPPATRPERSTSPMSSASPSPTVQLGADGRPLPVRPACAANDGGTFVLHRTSEGSEAGILVLGTGHDGVVLSPQSDGDICQWLPYARELAQHYRVAVFDWQVPAREVPLLAVRAVRAAGSRRVVLAGASMGGAYALADAHKVRPRLAGVMSFSGETTLRGGFDARPGIAAWTGPLLVLGSAHDAFFDSADSRVVARTHPGAETVLVLPGEAHGIDLLTDPAAPRVRSAVDRFLARVFG
jgi:pimeloyl-ACP methyl ester carboxylesterase